MNLYTTHFLPFSKRHGPFGSALLAACSGGPDSMALVRVLLEYRKCKGVAFGVAHVDHGWRKESADEAKQLEEMCKEMAVPFHLCTLGGAEMPGNLEEACRQARRDFFHQLCLQHNYCAVLLGHHLDDQAETVLKRVFEGARIEKCAGMQEKSVYRGTPFFRPFLHIRKQQLISWLEAKDQSYFLDPTNDDSQFLRGRLRTKILPEISQKFGKEIAPGLAFLGQEAGMLGEFMNAHLQQWLNQIEETPQGVILDLNHHCPCHLFEARCLITKLMPQASRQIAYAAAGDLLSGTACKRYAAGGETLQVDGKKLTLFTTKQFNLSGLGSQT